MIYIASSWRNSYYPEVVERLRREGFRRTGASRAVRQVQSKILKLEEKDFNIYLLGNEVDILSEDDYLAFVDFVKPSYYVFFDAVSKGAGELEVTSYCNSRYFIPGENSVTFSDRLLGSMAKSGSVKVTGVETCKDEDIVGKMTIPATHVVFAYGKEGQKDSINNGEKKAALIGAVIDALTNERKDK